MFNLLILISFLVLNVMMFFMCIIIYCVIKVPTWHNVHMAPSVAITCGVCGKNDMMLVLQLYAPTDIDRFVKRIYQFVRLLTQIVWHFSLPFF